MSLAHTAAEKFITTKTKHRRRKAISSAVTMRIDMTPDQLVGKGSEHGHQRALFAWANMAQKYGFAAADDAQSYSSKDYAEERYGVAHAVPDLIDLFAVPNGGKRDPVTAARLKAEGVKAGVSDVCLPVPVGGYHGLFIELKKLGGRTEADQIAFMARCNKRGYKAVKCVGWKEAKKVIEDYLLPLYTQVVD